MLAERGRPCGKLAVAFDSGSDAVAQRRHRPCRRGSARGRRSLGPLCAPIRRSIVFIVVTEWPRLRAMPSFLSPLLLRPGIGRTFSLVLQPVPIGKALRDARRHQVEAGDRPVDAEADRPAGDRRGPSARCRRRPTGARPRRGARRCALDRPHRRIGRRRRSARRGVHRDRVAASQALLDVRRLVGQQVEGFLAAALPFGVGLG